MAKDGKKQGQQTITLYIDNSTQSEIKDRQEKQSAKTVSTVALKALVRDRLPLASIVRKVILRLPDFLPYEDSIAKMDVIIDLLYDELGVA